MIQLYTLSRDLYGPVISMTGCLLLNFQCSGDPWIPDK